jgi:hypothetical protein
MQAFYFHISNTKCIISSPSFSYNFFVVLEIEPRALCILGKCSATELHLYSPLLYLNMLVILGLFLSLTLSHTSKYQKPVNHSLVCHFVHFISSDVFLFFFLFFFEIGSLYVALVGLKLLILLL